jgi:signal transduction histidine kinase
MRARGLLRYVIAISSVALASLITVLLHPVMPLPGTPLFLAAVMFSAWYCSLGASLLSTALAAMSFDYIRQAWSGFPEYGIKDVMRLGLFVGTALFITLLNQLRERMLSNEQMARSQAEEASRLKNEFLAMVSHELRTPLDAITGWAKVLADAGTDGQIADRALAAIRQNGESLSHLINDLLDASQTVTGHLHIDVRRIRLRPVIDEALETMRPEIESKGIHLDTSLDVTVDAVLGDPDRLKQVFCNILGNAVKFTPEGGRIEVVLRRVLTSSIHLIIRDNGAGIKQDSLPLIFERFHQSGVAETYGGLGLGLPIVRHLVELHEGKVEAYSSGEGRGATFTIELPLASESARPAIA